MTHTVRKSITEVHAARCSAISAEQNARADAWIRPEVPRRAFLLLFDCACTVRTVDGITQSQQTASGFSERSGDIHLVAWSCARACEDLASVDSAYRGDVEHERPRCAGDIAPNQRNTVASGQCKQPIDDAIEGFDLE